jgi:glycosyltransferase involved in cell wall biosynthesis
VPLAFDADNFEVINKKYHEDDRIVFIVCGKLEKRKRHEKIIQAWVKRFGDDKRYFLHCAVYNHFLTPEQNNAMISRVLDNKKYFNVSFFPNMAKNVTYNDFLNASDIVIGMSGGEGWGLPEFQAVALGKHGVIMNAHGYKGWANEENSVLVNPSEKIDCYDGVFFREGQEFNQGQIFDFDEDELVNAFEVALDRHKTSPVNENGLKLQKEFTFKNTVDSLLKLL